MSSAGAEHNRPIGLGREQREELVELGVGDEAGAVQASDEAEEAAIELGRRGGCHGGRLALGADDERPAVPAWPELGADRPDGRAREEDRAG